MFLSQNTSKYIYFLISFLSILTIIVLFLILPSANIKITPYKEVIMVDYLAHLSSQVQRAALNLDILPVKIEQINLIDKQKIKNRYQFDYFLFFSQEQNRVFLLKKEDLKNFINYRVNLNLQENISDKEGKELVLDLEKDITFWTENFKADALDLKINLQSIIIHKFDILDLKKNIKGKKNNLALEILKEKIDEHGNFELKIFPHFVPWVSWLEKRITIKIAI